MFEVENYFGIHDKHHKFLNTEMLRIYYLAWEKGKVPKDWRKDIITIKYKCLQELTSWKELRNWLAWDVFFQQHRQS